MLSTVAVLQHAAGILNGHTWGETNNNDQVRQGKYTNHTTQQNEKQLPDTYTGWKARRLVYE
jgi:hypothetical protein